MLRRVVDLLEGIEVITTRAQATPWPMPTEAELKRHDPRRLGDGVEDVAPPGSCRWWLPPCSTLLTFRDGTAFVDLDRSQFKKTLPA